VAGWTSDFGGPKLARLTFYRMESTGAYDDSVVVGAIYYSLDPGLDTDRTLLKKAIGQLKDVVSDF
jgi:hypothetical protein